MKRTTFLKRTAAALLLTVMTATAAWADIISSNGWSYNVVDGGCIITGKTTSDGDPTGLTILTIPKTIDGKTVVSISPDALSGFTDLTTIRFYQDASIQNMPYVQNNKKFTTVELVNNNGISIATAKNHLPDAMTEIGNAFKGSGITGLTMPGVTSIGDRAFEGCNSLTTLTFGQAVSIDTYSNAFSKISSTCTVSYPGSMEKWSCYNYQYSPNLVINCTDGSCGWCGDEWSDGMTPFQNSSCLYWTLDTDGHLVVDCVPQDIIYDNYLSKQSVKTQCWGKAKVESLTVGHVCLGYRAFYDHPNLTTVNISANVTSIGASPFESCQSLTRIVVDSNNPIYDSREGCNAIIETASNTLVVGCKNTTIPSSVTAIGGSAFVNCTGLTSITIPSSVTSIGGSAFSYCTGLTTVIIPNSVTTIGGSAFSYCTGLTTITIPNSVTTIERYAFYGCTNLTSITIPNRVTSIGGSAFRYCTGLTSITIPNSVTDIGINTFEGCTGLTSITIPNSVTTIGLRAFQGCTSLTDIYYDGTSKQWDQIEKRTDWNNGVPSTCQVYYHATVTTTAATEVEIPYGQEWTDIPVTVSSLYLGWFQNEGQPAHRADAVAVVPYRGTASSYFPLGTIDAYKGAGAHTVGNRVSEPLTAVGESGTLWIYIPKEKWDAAAAGEYSQFLYYDAAFLYNGTPAETGIYSLGSDAMVTVRTSVPETVTLTFDANNGSGNGNVMDAVTGRAGIAMTLPACTFIPQADKQFLCWNTKSDGTGISYMDGETVTFSKNTTLYAMWSHELFIDLTDVTEKVVDEEVWDVLADIKGYRHYSDNCLLIDVNLDGVMDVELILENDDVNNVLVCKAKKLTNLSGSYRFLMVENPMYELVLIKFTDGGGTVELPPLEPLDNDNGSYNTDRLTYLKNDQKRNMMLDGRTLYKDGAWNTLCLPFAVADFTGTVLDGATVMELDTDGTYGGHKTGLDGTTLYLNFKNATSMEAGKPYIVKWAGGTDITNPVFYGVTITETAPKDITFTGGKFCGTYDPIHFSAEDQTTLFLGAASTLYYPQPSGGEYPSIGAFRAYFNLSDTGNSAIAFRLNFGDDATGVASPQPSPEGKGDWYDLAGRKLDGEPTTPGLYIKDGKKIIVK